MGISQMEEVMMEIKEAKKEILEYILQAETIEDALEGIEVLKHLRKLTKPWQHKIDLDMFNEKDK